MRWGRLWTVCARGADQAASDGRSTSPLDGAVSNERSGPEGSSSTGGRLRFSWRFGDPFLDTQGLRLSAAGFGDWLLRGHGFDARFRIILDPSGAWVGTPPQRRALHRFGRGIAWCYVGDDELLAPVPGLTPQ